MKLQSLKMLMLQGKVPIGARVFVGEGRERGDGRERNLSEINTQGVSRG